MVQKRMAKRIPTKHNTGHNTKQAVGHPLMVNAKEWDKAKVVDIVCERLATSNMGIARALAEGFEGHEMPNYATWMRWLSADKDICDKYTRAKEDQADFMADEMLAIADDGTNDWMEKQGKDGENLGYQINGEHVQRSRLRVETRKWLASKLKPKKYGEKLAVGGDPDAPPLQVAVSMDEAARRVAFLLAKAAKQEDEKC